MLEMLGLTLYESIEVTLSDTTQDDYLTLERVLRLCHVMNV